MERRVIEELEKVSRRLTEELKKREKEKENQTDTAVIDAAVAELFGAETKQRWKRRRFSGLVEWISKAPRSMSIARSLGTGIKALRQESRISQAFFKLLI